MRDGERRVMDAEYRVARERILLSSEFTAWRAHTLGVMASPRGLGAALLAGFLAGGVLRRRPPKRHEAPVKKGALAVVTGLALSALRWRYGNPWNAVPGLLGWAGQLGARPRSGASRPPVAYRPPPEKR